MSVTFDNVIQCPFYISEAKHLLCCEGLFDTTCMTTSFPDKKAKAQHIDSFCSKIDGGGCPMADSLFEKYKRLGEKQSDEERLKRIKILDALVYSGKMCIHNTEKR